MPIAAAILVVATWVGAAARWLAHAHAAVVDADVIHSGPKAVEVGIALAGRTPSSVAQVDGTRSHAGLCRVAVGMLTALPCC